MDNLGHFTSVNTNTVQVFCTEAEKMALLVTVPVLLRYILDPLCKTELRCTDSMKGKVELW